MDLGRASLESPDFPGGPPDGSGAIEVDGREWRFQHVNVGNPQCVVEAGDEVENLDLQRLGRRIEVHELFPNRTNASFVRFGGSDVRARIYERGAGETLASGTGASGAAVAAHLRGAPSPVTVRMDGGTLEVEVSDELDVVLTGTAEPVYTGELAPDFLDALGRIAS
jgi:diaminopimelate epimerase